MKNYYQFECIFLYNLIKFKFLAIIIMRYARRDIVRLCYHVFTLLNKAYT